MQRRFLGTDLPLWLMVLLVVITLPRGILNDLGIITDTSLTYRLLALVPIGIWLLVALFRKTLKPFMDFMVLGTLYGVFLGLTHQIFWNAWSHKPPAVAVSLADKVDPSLETFVIRLVTFLVSLFIGVVAGLVIGLVALGAAPIRKKLQRK